VVVQKDQTTITLDDMSRIATTTQFESSSKINKAIMERKWSAMMRMTTIMRNNENRLHQE
jgi:hypothetical protein